MRLVGSAPRAEALLHILRDPAQLPATGPLAAEARRRLARGPVVVVPTLGHQPQRLLALVLLPAAAEATLLRRRAGAVARALLSEQCTSLRVADLPADFTAAQRDVLLAGLAQGAYVWDRYRGEAQPRLERVAVPGLAAAARRKLQAELDAVALARDLINTPAADLGPADFVAAARRACRGSGLRLRVIDEAGLRRLAAGCHLAVGRSSPRARRPRLLRIEWPGRGARQIAVALCGKGVCFDTGGLDIKPASGMASMRKDMGGAATVLAAMLVAAARGCRQRLCAYLPLADNAIDGDAMRPGDILRALDGTTVEVDHTDAEGRLLLADAIALARREGAAEILSVATLTGAALVALGRIHVPVMGSDAAVAPLVAAGTAVGEKLWRLPLDDEHRALVRGRNARLTNSTGKADASCITAGAFLAHFAGDLPFAHCDISPASWQDSPHDLGPAGATGVLVATLAARLSR